MSKTKLVLIQGRGETECELYNFYLGRVKELLYILNTVKLSDKNRMHVEFTIFDYQNAMNDLRKEVA